MRNTVKMGATLMIICVCAAVLLSLVYGVTSKQIAENERIANIKKRKKVLPQAVTFEEREIEGIKYHAGLDAEKNEIGFVIKAVPWGYGGPIKITVGVAMDDSISAIELTKLDQRETPGLGAKIVKNKFKDQFKGKRVEQLKVKQDGGEIDAVTAATITSRAAADGIRKELDKFIKNRQK